MSAVPRVSLAGYVVEHEAAELLGYSAITLARLRRRGVGPAYIQRQGKDVIYKVSDLERWLDSQRVDPEAV
jgi:hypothetical protein